MIYRFLLPVGTLALALFICACQPNTQSIDELQQQINSANKSIAEMDTLTADLDTFGISIHSSTLEAKTKSERLIAWREPKFLIEVKAKLEEFIIHGKKVILISSRPGVVWGGKFEVEIRIKAAEHLINQIDKRLSLVPTTGSFSLIRHRFSKLICHPIVYS